MSRRVLKWAPSWNVGNASANGIYGPSITIPIPIERTSQRNAKATVDTFTFLGFTTHSVGRWIMKCMKCGHESKFEFDEIADMLFKTVMSHAEVAIVEDKEN